jgi:acetylornithine deacetylase/succinyl-diaminopimelate desuccinylase-like protein
MRWILSALIISAAFGAEPDWNKVNEETLRHYRALIQMDTTVSEAPAAEYLKKVLEAEGIPVEIFAKDPKRPNVVARIKGNGSKRPVLIMAHTDTVGVQPEKWAHPPFSAAIDGEFVYGRGTIDDKDNVTAALMTMLLLKRLNVALDRDVIFLAESGEEGNSAIGAQFVVNEHWDAIAAEFCIAEGGQVYSKGGKISRMLVATTEKVPYSLRLVAHGTSGHGSRPLPDNAIARLSNALSRISSWEPPMRLNDTTRAYFERLAAISPPQSAARYRDILNPARAAETDRYFRRNEPGHYSILRTSVVPTIVNIGFRSNVIPSEGEAMLDVRALPDEDMTKFVAELRRVIDDPSIEVIPPKTNARPVAPPSRIDTDLFRAFEKTGDRLFKVPVLPNMMTGATDNAQLRAKGVQAYGIGPIVTPEEGPLGGAHTDDEHISVRSLMALIEYLWNALMEVG